MGRHAHSKSSGPLVPVFTLKRRHSCSFKNRCSACATGSLVRPSGVISPICSVEATERRKPVLVVFQPGAQVQIVAIHGIGDDPGDGDLRLMHPFHHRPGQLTLRLKADGLRNADFFAASAILQEVDEEDTAPGRAACDHGC
jgi:hypothetical protein